MPNDAKLGLLVGVVGVIVAAVLSANRAAVPAGNAGAVRQDLPPSPVAKPTPEKSGPEPKVEAASPGPGELPAGLPSTPVARPKREPDGTPVGREPKPGDEP